MRQTTYKIYRGQTGHQWLQGAEVCKSTAGIPEIFSKCGSFIFHLGDDDRLLIEHAGGFLPCRLKLSDRDIERMRAFNRMLCTHIDDGV